MHLEKSINIGAFFLEKSMKKVYKEVKSGKDYYIHRAMDTFLTKDGYPVKHGIVLSNEREVREEKNVWYMPIYFMMFL